MTPLGLAVRFIHLTAGLSLVGIFTLGLLAGRSDRLTARAWEVRLLSLTRWLTLALLVSGVAVLGHQTMVVTDRAGAALEPASWLRLLLQSRFGIVWLVRHGILLLLAALILLRQREESAADWGAWRVEAWALAAIAAGAMAWAGHAAAVEPWGLVAAFSDALHLIAAGAWVGALLPLALLLRAASSDTGADARPFAVLTVRRFSTLALVLMLVIVLTGLWNSWVQVSSVPALVGTRYGWLLLIKAALLLPILALARANRRRLLPALAGDGATVGRPAMLRLGRHVGWECAVALGILAITSALTLTAPARHESPWWPFSYRLSYEAVAGLPGVSARLLIGSQLAFLGLLGLIVGWLLTRKRGVVVGAGAVALMAGLWIAVPPLAVDAYPTTYRRSPIPYHAASVANGMALYRAHCAVCHGRSGRGDGPGGAGLPKLPADLTASHTARHTAGDLFWWLTQGIPAGGMPSFGAKLSAEERWDLINFLRALSAGAQSRALGALVEPNRPRLVAPDFAFAVGPTPLRSLRDLRGRRAVVLVLFSLPESRQRISQLARSYEALQALGVEILAVPADDSREIITRLGDHPPILFPVATEGDGDIARTYGLFALSSASPAAGAVPSLPSHAEFLIDRQGYLRARWIPGAPGAGWGDPMALFKEIRGVNAEAPTAAPPDEHVH